jgi:hypothetical protein
MKTGLNLVSLLLALSYITASDVSISGSFLTKNSFIDLNAAKDACKAPQSWTNNQCICPSGVANLQLINGVCSCNLGFHWEDEHCRENDLNCSDGKYNKATGDCTECPWNYSRYTFNAPYSNTEIGFCGGWKWWHWVLMVLGIITGLALIGV